jgi:ribosomal protein S9
MEILARAVGRRKEAVAQVQIIRGTGQFIINDKVAKEYLHNNACSLLSVTAPFGVVEKTNSSSVSVTFGTSNSQLVDSEIVSVTSSLGLRISDPDVNAGSTLPLPEASPLASPSDEGTHSLGDLDGLASSKEQNVRSFWKGEGGLIPYSLKLETFDTIVKVKGGGLIGQAEAIKLGIARALCNIESMKISLSGIDPSLLITNNQEVPEIRKQLKTKGYLTQDSRVKERRKYGLKKARKASQYHKR